MELAREDGLEERGRDRDAADLADPAEELAEPGPDRHRVFCVAYLVSAPAHQLGDWGERLTGYVREQRN